MKLPAFAPIGRGLGVLNSLALPAIALWQVLTAISDTDILALGPYTACVGLLVRGVAGWRGGGHWRRDVMWCWTCGMDDGMRMLGVVLGGQRRAAVVRVTRPSRRRADRLLVWFSRGSGDGAREKRAQRPVMGRDAYTSSRAERGAAFAPRSRVRFDGAGCVGGGLPVNTRTWNGATCWRRVARRAPAGMGCSGVTCPLAVVMCCGGLRLATRRRSACHAALGVTPHHHRRTVSQLTSPSFPAPYPPVTPFYLIIPSSLIPCSCLPARRWR
jgi:hypothetical protein